jgi:hypothetical protein
MGLLPILRQIAAGTLLPEVVVLYAGQPAALKKIAAMPIPEQQRVAAREYVVDTAPARKPQRSPWRASGRYEPANESSRQPTVSGIATNGGAKDVAEMACNLVAGHAQPGVVFAEFLKQLRARPLDKDCRKAVEAAVDAALGVLR